MQAYEPAGGFRFGEVTISPFVILHACLGDERFVVCQRSHDIRQVVMGSALKRVANRKWRVVWDRQSIGARKLRANIAARIAFHLGMIFKPQQETFFELATERLPDHGARFEARNPP